jgi:hypothetical protein
MLHITLDTLDLSESEIQQLVRDSARLGSTTPEATVSLTIYAAELAALLFGVPTAVSQPVNQPSDGAEVRHAAPVTAAVEPIASAEAVRRRTKDELAAGLTVEQAALFRASGYDSAVRWLEETQGVQAPAPAAAPAQAPAAAPAPAPTLTPGATEVVEVDYDTLKGQVLLNVRKGLKDPTLRVAMEVFDVDNYTKLTSPAEWGRAYVLLKEVERTGAYPSAEFIESTTPF